MAKQLGEYLRQRREELGLTPSQVHIKSKGAVNSSTLSKIENGKRNAGPEILAALASVLKIDVQELYRIAYGLPGGSEVLTAEKEEDEDPLEVVDRLLKKQGTSAEKRRAVRTVLQSVLADIDRR